MILAKPVFSESNYARAVRLKTRPVKSMAPISVSRIKKMKGRSMVTATKDYPGRE